MMFLYRYLYVSYPPLIIVFWFVVPDFLVLACCVGFGFGILVLLGG